MSREEREGRRAVRGIVVGLVLVTVLWGGLIAAVFAAARAGR